MVAVAIRLRDRLLIAVAVTQAALVAGSSTTSTAIRAINCFPLLVFVPLAPRHAARRGRPGRAAITREAVGGRDDGDRRRHVRAVRDRDPARPVVIQAEHAVRRLHPARARNIFPQPRVAAAHAIYAGPFMPGLYHALGKPNPFFVAETVVCNAACQRRLRAQLDQVRPEIAFLAYDMVRHLGYDQNNPVDGYFRERYVGCRQDEFEGLIILRHRPELVPRA